jgi:hypothetical protein
MFSFLGLSSVIPAKAEPITTGLWNMGPRLREDDKAKIVARTSATRKRCPATYNC